MAGLNINTSSLRQAGQKIHLPDKKFVCPTINALTLFCIKYSLHGEEMLTILVPEFKYDLPCTGDQSLASLLITCVIFCLYCFQGGSQGMMFGNQSTTTTQVSIPKDVSNLSIPKDVSASRLLENHYILRTFHSANFLRNCNNYELDGDSGWHHYWCDSDFKNKQLCANKFTRIRRILNPQNIAVWQYWIYLQFL